MTGISISDKEKEEEMLAMLIKININEHIKLLIHSRLQQDIHYNLNY